MWHEKFWNIDDVDYFESDFELYVNIYCNLGLFYKQCI